MAAAAGRPPTGGHDSLLFDSAPPEYALCPICYNVLAEPQSCQRGHRRVAAPPLSAGPRLQPSRSPTGARLTTASGPSLFSRAPRRRSFCQVCITAWLSRRNTCPVDREALDRTVPNLGLRAAVGALRLKCPKGAAAEALRKLALAGDPQPLDKESCGAEAPHCWWVGALEALPEHLRLCALVPTPCLWAGAGCKAQPPRYALAAHGRSCAHALAQCAHCGEQHPARTAAAHAARCPDAPAHCPHDGCHVTLPRAALREHTRSCQLRPVCCPLGGCSATVPCLLLWQHLAWPEPRHVRLLAQQYCALDRRLGDALAQLAQAGLEQHAATLTPQHAELERLRAQNAALKAHLATYEPEEPFEPEPPPQGGVEADEWDDDDLLDGWGAEPDAHAAAGGEGGAPPPPPPPPPAPPDA